MSGSPYFAAHNTQSVRPAQVSTVKRFVPHYKGEPVAGFGPAGVAIKAGARTPTTLTPRERQSGLVPYYTDTYTSHHNAGPSGQESTQWNAAQVARAKQIQAANYGGPGTVLRSILPGGLNEGGATNIVQAAGRAANAASLALPGGGVGEAAGLLGLGLAKGLRGIRAARGIAEGAPQAAHMTEEAAAVRGALPGAKVVRGATEAGYSAQRREINAKVSAIYADKNLSVEERQRLADAALSGPLERPTYTGLMKLKGPGLESLTAQIMEHPQLQGKGFTQKRLINSLNAAVEGKVPTKSELRLFEQVFGKDQTAGIVKAAKTGRLKTILENVVNVPRTMQATLDMSALLRQNLVAFGHSPMTTVRNAPLLVKSFASEKQATQATAKMEAHPYFPLLKDMGVSFTGATNPQQEEQFGAHMLEQIGGRANPIHWSSRSYSTFLNQQRFDLGVKLINEAKARGYNIHDPQFGQDLGRAINDFTGRGHLPGETLQRSAKLLNGLFFSPRLLSSRFRILLSPANVALAKRNPYVYRQYLKAFVRTFGALTSVLYAAKRAGVDVGVDPRSADFGKMKFGNTRVDLAGGFAQFAHLAGELGTMQRKSTTTGQMTNLRSGKYGQPTVYDVLSEFLTSKASPPLSLGIDFAKGQTGIGKFNPKQEAVQRLTPLSAQDVADVVRHRSKGWLGPAEVGGAAALATFGAGLQTYPPRAPKTRLKRPADYFGSDSGGGGSPYFSSSSQSGGGGYFK